MNKVNLFLIGVHKAGTSWLYYLLNAHPDVFIPEVKELYFFGDQGRPQERPPDLDAYHAHFPLEADYRYFGDATVMYYRSPQAAADIQSYNPEARVIAIVRDPIDRTLSDVRYHRQLGLLPETTPLDAVIDDALRGNERPEFVRDSHYEQTLPVYAERFGDQFTVVRLEDGRDDPEAFWKHLLDVLDLPPHPLPKDNDRPENPTGSAAFRWVYRNTIRPLRRAAPGLYRWMLTSRVARVAKQGLLRILGTATPETLSPSTKRKLRAEFASTYAYLGDLGRSAE